jgi:5-methylcytosine-specific restriction enzyme A
MPVAPPKPCRHPGCGALVRDGSGRCPRHKVVPGSFADPNRGSRHERGYGSSWDRLRKRILERDCGLCQQCKREGRLTACGGKPYSAFVDHVVPKAEGGTDDESNLETLCATCHKSKTDREKLRGRGGESWATQPLGPNVGVHFYVRVF